ncbi:hypothetical protein KGM_209321 [Danaus plexippus plexippus]|uniref:Uncharacterized protein n=1 Tax=Danaus plexippus plexippus TaxID=278856 RepID=A0A212EM20_DANPL|nr:hypothetical protein KGM_209321 [Danaus plexippus plexippus]
MVEMSRDVTDNVITDRCYQWTSLNNTRTTRQERTMGRLEGSGRTKSASQKSHLYKASWSSPPSNECPGGGRRASSLAEAEIADILYNLLIQHIQLSVRRERDALAARPRPRPRRGPGLGEATVSCQCRGEVARGLCTML